MRGAVVTLRSVVRAARRPSPEPGQRYGRLLVIRRAGTTGYGGVLWECECDCGNRHGAVGANLISGATRSCGCLRREERIEQNRTHGLSDTPEYGIWCRMIARCHRPLSSDYDYYGGRGITVVPEWRDSFEKFFADMGTRTTNKHTIDRRDVNGDYGPDNCYWATWTEQQNNKRNNVRLSYNGDELTIMEWARRTGITRHAIEGRLERGWSVQDTLTTPIGAYGRRRRRRPRD